MKTRTVLISLFVGLLLLTVTSCSKVIDAQLAALEKSIDKLEEKYKDMTPKEVEKAIDLVETQIDALEEREDDMTKEQKKTFANLEGRYTKVLLKIELYLTVNNLFGGSEVEETIEYIKGLMGE